MIIGKTLKFKCQANGWTPNNQRILFNDWIKFIIEQIIEQIS